MVHTRHTPQIGETVVQLRPSINAVPLSCVLYRPWCQNNTVRYTPKIVNIEQLRPCRINSKVVRRLAVSLGLVLLLWIDLITRLICREVERRLQSNDSRRSVEARDDVKVPIV